jgi:type VI secretion system secreted protein Hcp
MAYDAFLNLLAGGVKGESQKKNHELEIELVAFSWGATNPSSAAMGPGSGAGKVAVHDFSVLKRVDRASPALFQKCCDGTTFPQVEVSFQKAGGDDPIVYLRVTFEHVFVTTFQWSGANGRGDDTPLESISFTFKTCQIDYAEQNDDGTLGDQVQGSWDLSQGAPK